MGVSADTELGIGGKTLAVALIADNQAVVVADNVLLNITSDNATPANRTFTLSAPAYSGQRLAMVFTSATNSCQLAIAATMKISAAWEPLELDSLHLIGLGGIWYELGRSDNSP